MAFVEWWRSTWEWLCLAGDGSWQGFYAQNLRDSLFNGCLTLGGFIFAAYTFIVIHMKSSVYDSDEYQATFREKAAADSRLKLYDPLKRMSNRLFYAVVVTLAAAVMQLTIGLWANNGASLVATLAAIYALGEVYRSLRVMGSNMNAWFASLERHGAVRPSRALPPT